MRVLAIALALLIVALQYPLWLGKGGWLRVRELDTQVAAQKEVNAERKARNTALDADVRDLKQGFEAVEERARSELGMIRHDEVFFSCPRTRLRPRRAPLRHRRNKSATASAARATRTRTGGASLPTSTHDTFRPACSASHLATTRA